MAKKEQPKPRTKTQLVSEIAERVGYTKAEVRAVFEAIQEIIAEDLSPKGPESFNLYGILKINVKHTPAMPERPGVNPGTGEPTTYRAKPAGKKIKIRPLKPLKDALV